METTMADTKGQTRLTIIDLPIEILSHILRALFPHLSPPSDAIPPSLLSPAPIYSPTPLHLRLLLHRHLSLIHRSFHHVSRQLFFEEVPCLTVDAIKGLLQTFVREERGEEAVGWRLMRTEASFVDGYQGSISSPRQPRKRLDGRNVSRWEPSIVHLASHYRSFQHDLSSLFHASPSLRSLTLSMSCPLLPQTPSHTLTKYNQTWPSPSLSDSTLLTALMGCTNLRELELVDPAPLEAWGPALRTWSRLDSLSITLRTPQMCANLDQVTFCPPKSLNTFKFVDHVCVRPWPLAADLGACEDLRHLTLGAKSFVGEQTLAAVGFLLNSYKDSLVSLTFEDPSRSGSRPTTDLCQLLAGYRAGSQTSAPGFDSDLRIALTSLTHLFLPLSSVERSTLSGLRLPKLIFLKVRCFVDGGNLCRAEAWVSALRGFGELKRVECALDPDAPLAAKMLKERGVELVVLRS